MLRTILSRAACPAAIQSRPAAFSCTLWIKGCSSSSSAFHEEADPRSENDHVSKEFLNRNPRNLEHLGIAYKRKGWPLQYPRKDFYHRLVFEMTNRHVSAYVEHSSGKRVVSASTKEFAIAKYLYSRRDVSAAHNIGRILAQRCLESGINRMILHSELSDQSSQKFQAFYSAIQEGGLDLTEPEEYAKPYEPGIDYDSIPDKEQKRMLGISWV